MGVQPSPGNDTINGNKGNDTIQGMQGDDLVRGGQGNDSIHGGAGNDVLFGDLGDDVIAGSSGIDILTGGGGADIFVSSNGGREYITDFQPGDDKIRLEGLDRITKVVNLGFVANDQEMIAAASRARGSSPYAVSDAVYVGQLGNEGTFVYKGTNSLFILQGVSPTDLSVGDII